jgi:hypothetical protein
VTTLVVTGLVFVLGARLEKWFERRAQERARIKARLPRRIG